MTGVDRERRAEVNRVAGLMMAEWERVEGSPVSASFVASFADMARVVIADRADQPHPAPLTDDEQSVREAVWQKGANIGHYKAAHSSLTRELGLDFAKTGGIVGRILSDLRRNVSKDYVSAVDHALAARAGSVRADQEALRDRVLLSNVLDYLTLVLDHGDLSAMDRRPLRSAQRQIRAALAGGTDDQGGER